MDPKDSKKANLETSKLRIAIVNKDKCRPQKCGLECKKNCSVNKTNSFCIEVMKTDKISVIHENLCIGCALCVNRCPYGAIKIINLPMDMSKDLTHNYGLNCFKLHRLPQPRQCQVLGLVGTNGIGKSTALNILSGKLRPNLGRPFKPPENEEIIKNFRGSDLQTYFQKLFDNKIKAVIKPQYVDMIPKAIKGQVGELIKQKDQTGRSLELLQDLQLGGLLDRDVKQLSGGELQRFAILMASVSKAEMYMFDEPTSYLDIKQRIIAANAIRTLINQQTYIICVEHDLTILDYISDIICVLYGEPGAYGIVSCPYSDKQGINIFLSGFEENENLRFREQPLCFKVVYALIQNLQTLDLNQLILS